jgi:hypothetical protein
MEPQSMPRSWSILFECCNKNMEKALQSGGKSLTLKGLQRRIDIMSGKLASWKDDLKMFRSAALLPQ